MQDIAIYQIECKVFLTRNITYQEMQETITYFVDQVLVKNEEMSQLHQRNCYKNYVISGFKQIASNGIYQEGTVNTFFIRSTEKNLAEYLQKKLANSFTNKLKGLTCQIRQVKPRMIQKLYLLTQAVAKFEDGYWRKAHTLEEYQKRILDNSIKKYNQITQEKMEEPVSLFSHFKLINRVPIKVKYKNIHLLGDKFEGVVNEDEKVQQLAKIIIARGVLECNARGFGFTNYKSM